MQRMGISDMVMNNSLDKQTKKKESKKKKGERKMGKGVDVTVAGYRRLV